MVWYHKSNRTFNQSISVKKENTKIDLNNDRKDYGYSRTELSRNSFCIYIGICKTVLLPDNSAGYGCAGGDGGGGRASWGCVMGF